MEFKNSNKLKGYLSNEAKRLNIHSNYAYTYYFLRNFLTRLNQENPEKFILCGSVSQLANTQKLIRPITDLDITSCLDIFDSSYIIEKMVRNNKEIDFKIKNKFITTNDTVNFRVMCNFGAIQHLIKVDLKKDNNKIIVTKDLPLIMTKDEPLKIKTITKEQHIANKIYVILRNASHNKISNKDMRRLKDFYDFYYLIKDHDFNEELVQQLLKEKFNKYGEIDIKSIEIELLNSDFINENKEKFLEEKKQYGFSNVSFNELVDVARDEIKRRI